MSDISGPFSTLIEDWSGVTTTNVIPAGQRRWYNNVTGYQTSEIIELCGDGTTTIASLPKRQVLTDGAQTIYGNKVFDGSVTAAVLPPVGFVYTQDPFQPTPLSLYGSGTWINISEKAAGYELSTSGWVSREDVGQTAWTETDYAVSDTISGSPGGTYDGETVSTVFTMAGQTVRVEGGSKALAFESGTQGDAMQRITGDFGGLFGYSGWNNQPGTGVFTYSSGQANTFTSGGGDTTNVAFDSADSTSPNTAKTDDDETRMTNFTIRKWKRTA